MDTDFLNARNPASSLHFMMKKGLGYLKDAVIPTISIKHLQILLHFFREKSRHLDHAVTLRCLWSSYEIFALQSLVGLVDSHCIIGKVKSSIHRARHFPRRIPVQ